MSSAHISCPFSMNGAGHSVSGISVVVNRILWLKLFEGFVKVELKTPEEFLVVGSSFSHKLLGHLFGPLLLERVACRTSLRHLVLDKGLLGLNLAPVLSSQIGGAPEKELGHLNALIVKGCDV